MTERTYFLSNFGPGSQIAARQHDQVEAPWSRILELWATCTVNPIKFTTTDTKAKADAIHLESFIALDIDSGLSLDEAEAILLGSPWAFILGTTRNHQKVKTTRGGQIKPACDRFRVILPLESPMDELDWRRSVFYLNDLFRNAIDADVSYVHPSFPISVISFREPGSLIQAKDASSGPTKAELFPVPELVEFFTTDWKRYAVSGLIPGKRPTKGARGIGYISHDTRAFLEGRSWIPGSGGWHGKFIRACADLRDQGYLEAEAIPLLLKVTGTLDTEDYAQIKDIFKRPRLQSQRFNSQGLNGGEDQGSSGGSNESGSSSSSKDKKKAYVPPHLVAATVNRFMSQGMLQNVLSERTLDHEILDGTERTVRFFQNDQIMDRYISSQVNLKENKEHIDPISGEVHFKPLTIEQALKAWRSDGRVETELPTPFGFKGDPHWTVKRLPFDMTEAGPYPAWEEFLVRLSDRTLFMAWVASVFDLKNKGRQALWLHGPKGRDGKTHVLNAIANVLGDGSTTIQGSSLKETRFVFSQLFNKRLITYPDCKMPWFVRDEFFRNITGGDKVSVEFKGDTPITMELHAKLAVASNYLPSPSNEGADLSRLLIINVSESPIKDDGEWTGRLEAEMGYFLNACQSHYKELQFQDGKWKHDFKLTGFMAEELLIEAADSGTDEFEFWMTKFEVNKNLPDHVCITPAELYEKCMCEQGNRMSRQSYREFQRYLEHKHGIKPRRIVGKRVFPGLRSLAVANNGPGM